ncbi:uncharacterized protein LOC124996249 [Mugil cephalus]|uniref:uncharacterized protein LOC124996249 n=1 Tax=Mugil cephalus TaxID=48193 RepID=UPI001FB767F9|nr:uncharacterized protein LOC124996249 [Mugil cephalus]
MDWTLVIVLQLIFQPALSVFFTVDAEQAAYQSEFGGNVVMGCKFHPKPSTSKADLTVRWHWITQNSVQEVVKIVNGNESSDSHKFKGRVRLLTEELKNGWAKLQISNLRINDSGNYQCLVQTEEGADYKTISLSVVAPYKSVTKRIEKTPGGDTVLITCQSEGYPESSVLWEGGHMLKHNASTTIVTTSEQLFKITSQLQVSSSSKNSYTCNFTKDGYSATFHIPDEIPVPPKNDALVAVICLGVIMVAIAVGLITYRQRRQKGSRTDTTQSTRNLLGNDRIRSLSPTACLHIERENEKIFNEGHVEENLRLSLKHHYSEISLNAEVRRQHKAFSVEELPHRLLNNEGHPVSLQALLPEAGEKLFLEGLQGSGKTTVANILVSSWTDGPKHSLTDFLDLSALHLLIYVNCSTAKGDLFQEITTQLSLTKNISAEELRTLLIKSRNALLLLDGYREGNHLFDESLRRFLSEVQGCRVLVTACPGHCPMLKQTFGTEGLLNLQMPTQKS